MSFSDVPLSRVYEVNPVPVTQSTSEDFKETVVSPMQGGIGVKAERR